MALIKSKKKLCFNSEQWLQMQGLVHTYIHDRNHVICGMNQLQLDVMKDLGYCEKDIIGNSIDSIFYNDQDKGNIVILENETVLAENIPKQYYNTLIVKEFYRIELLTTKIPIYDTEGKFLVLQEYRNILINFIYLKSEVWVSRLAKLIAYYSF